MIFDFVPFIGSFTAGLIAAISGFGIGSVVTPIVAAETDTKLAVAVVSIPHLIGTFIRFLRLRKHVNRSLAVTFGTASAVGGLAGALLHAYANAPILGYVFGVL